MNKKIYKQAMKKSGDELQAYLLFKRRGSSVRTKKGKGSYSRKQKHKDKECWVCLGRIESIQSGKTTTVEWKLLPIGKCGVRLIETTTLNWSTLNISGISAHGIFVTIVLVFLRALSSIINMKSADGMNVKSIGGIEAKSIPLAKKSIKIGFVIEINKRH